MLHNIYKIHLFHHVPTLPKIWLKFARCVYGRGCQNATENEKYISVYRSKASTVSWIDETGLLVEPRGASVIMPTFLKQSSFFAFKALVQADLYVTREGHINDNLFEMKIVCKWDTSLERKPEVVLEMKTIRLCFKTSAENANPALPTPNRLISVSLFLQVDLRFIHPRICSYKSTNTVLPVCTNTPLIILPLTVGQFSCMRNATSAPQ